MKHFLFLCLLSFTFSIQAQQKDSLKQKEFKNNVNLSYLGETVGLTLNYQRYLYQTKNVHLGLEIGAGTTFLNYINLAVPIILSAEFGKKHRVCAELAMSNIIDFTPYPKTKAERDSVQKIPYEKYSESQVNFWDIYQQPYNYTLAANIGYKFIAKKGLILSLLEVYLDINNLLFKELILCFYLK